MQHIDPSPPLALGEPFASLTELTREHVALMRTGRTLSERSHQVFRIQRFLERAQATGTRLDGFADRDAAQSILDYWTATLADLPDNPDLPPSLIVLAPFDPSQGDDLADQDSPYKGLSAFKESDASWFFGRGEAVKLLLDVVEHQRLVIVAGPSGSGKSSLILAGLLPRLKAGSIVGSERWHYFPTLTPGSDPLASLLVVTCPDGKDLSAWIAEHKPKLRNSPEYLRKLVHSILAHSAAGQESQPAVLIVDQFEELFTLCTDQQIRTDFVSALLSIVHEAEPQHRVILTIREDFVQEAMQLPGLKDHEATPFRPPPLTSAELRRVIEEPAKKIGLRFEEGLIDELVREVVGDPTTLPLLQFALKQLWDHRERNRITWNAYEKVGRPAEALKRTAEKLFTDLRTFENQKTAERIFLELVQPSVGAEFVRRRVRRETLTRLEAADRVNRVLARLVDAGLLVMVPGSDADGDRFEVAHEALIRNWPRFADWLRRRKQQSERELQLIATARLWRDSGRKPGYLLSGDALQEAAQYRDAAPALNELILASENASRRYARRINRITTAAAIAFLFISVFACISAFSAIKQTKAAQSSLDLAVKAITVLTREVDEQITEDPYSSAASDLLNIARELLAAADKMSETTRETLERTAARTNLLISVSDIYFAKDDYKSALEFAERAHALAERLVNAAPGEQKWQSLLYQSKFRIGDAVERSDPQRAMQEYGLALQIAQQMAKENPTSSELRQYVAFIEPKIGDLFLQKDDFQRALEQYNKSLAIYQELTQLQPDNLNWWRTEGTT